MSNELDGQEFYESIVRLNSNSDIERWLLDNCDPIPCKDEDDQNDE